MSQVIYLVLIFFVSLTMTILYLFLGKLGKFIKLLLIFLFSILFSYICYLYNYFIFNEYVFLTILYAIYIGNLVKLGVNKRINKL